MAESGKLKCVELPLAMILILNSFIVFYNLLCNEAHNVTGNDD